MQGRALLSTSIQPTSAHKVTAQKSVNTRRNSTLRSCVLLCGVSWSPWAGVWREGTAGVAGSVCQADFTVVLLLSWQRVLEWIPELIPVSLTWPCLPRDEMANTGNTAAKDFVHQNEKRF